MTMQDVLVIGGGPAGSTAATLLARKGFSVTLLERERFPRFQIGESLLPYNNDLFERLGVADQLVTGEYHPKYGAEFLTGDGKLSYTFRFDQNLEEAYHRSFQVRRSEFDHLLLRNAAAAGVDVREETSVTSVDLSDSKRAVVTTNGGKTLEARFLVDASGHGAVAGQSVGGKRDVESLKKIAFFAHYSGVQRAEGRNAGNTVIVVLRNGWFWLIPVTSEIMSVGLVVDRELYKSCGLQPEELLRRTIAETPWVAERMRDSKRLTPVLARKDFSFRMSRCAGPNFALVGDAAGFLDPIFSTGVFLAMKSADLAADAIEQRLNTGRMRLLDRYQREVNRVIEKYFRFIEHFYKPEFIEIFLQPRDRFGLIKVIVEVLAGNVFGKRSDRFKLALFFLLVAIQKRHGVIARRIDWDAMPQVASAATIR
jgi:flavin-dependent dehydrogenase